MRITPRDTGWDGGCYCAIAVRHYFGTDHFCHNDRSRPVGVPPTPRFRARAPFPPSTPLAQRGPHENLRRAAKDFVVRVAIAAAAGGSAHPVAPDAAVDATAESPGRLAHTPAFA